MKIKDEMRANRRWKVEGARRKVFLNPSFFIIRDPVFISHPSPFSLHKEGFTLLEVLISLAIIGGLLITLIYTLNYHLGLAERQKTVTVATLLAKNKIADLERSPENDKGAFDPPYDNYAYETSVKESPYIGVSEIAVVVKKEKEEVKLNEFIFK
jgi:general secretion pathway protein I